MICGRRAADWRNAMLMTSLSACSVPARNTWLPLRSVHEVRATQAGNAHCGFGQPNTSAHQRYAQRRRIKNESGWLKLQDWTLTDELARLATEWKSSQGMKFCNLSSVSCPHIRPSMSSPAVSAFPQNRAWCCSSGVAQTKLKVRPGYVDPSPSTSLPLLLSFPPFPPFPSPPLRPFPSSPSF